NALSRVLLDGARTAREQGSAPRIGVPPDHGHARLGKSHGQRKPDVAEPDDPDRRVAALESLLEFRRHTAAGTGPAFALATSRLRRRHASLWMAARTASATSRTSPSRSSGKHGSDKTSAAARAALGKARSTSGTANRGWAGTEIG